MLNIKLKFYLSHLQLPNSIYQLWPIQLWPIQLWPIYTSAQLLLFLAINKTKFKTHPNLNNQQLFISSKKQKQLFHLSYMDKTYSLNLIQDEEFKAVINSLPKDQKIEDLALKYYVEFKKHQTSLQSDKIVLYMKCAYYLAEKSVWITNVNGEKIRNAGLSLSELLKKNTLEDIMITLKQYSRRITIEDPQTLDDLQKLIKQISFLITFYNKFEKVLLKLELKEKNPQYSQTLSEFVWLLYIESKNKILYRSLQLIDNTCMLAHCLSYVICFSWDHHQPGYFTKGENNLLKITSGKQIIARVQEKVLELFLIKSLESYRNIADRFQTYFSYLKKSGIIKTAPEKNNFAGPQFLQGNYKRLDHLYQKKLDYNHLDQRIFFKDRTSNITPNKFTPFARQKVQIPSRKLGGNLSGLSDRTVHQGNYMSHRILNYDAMQNQVSQTSHNDSSPCEIKFPKNIMQTPINTIPIIQQTPYTAGIMMYNYVNDLSSRLQKKNISSRQVDRIVFELIDVVLGEAIKDENKKSKEIKRNHIFSVFKLVADDFGVMYPEEVQCEEITKAILLVSMQIVFFVSNIQVSFDRLQEQMAISHLSLWRAIDFFLKFDRSMPAAIKVHLLDLQVDIISQKIWSNQQTVINIQKFLSNQKLPCKQTQVLYEKLCRRILHQIAFQIIQLSKKLFQSKDQEQAISEIAFDTMKEVLLRHPYMILYNHFDQIIMCTMYCICRALTMAVKFQIIREAYLMSNAHLSEQKKLDMFTNIHHQYENGQTQNGTKGIISFYNSHFLGVMKQFVNTKVQNYLPNSGNQNSSRPSTQRTLQQKDMNVLLQSPISGIIPKQTSYGINKMANNQNNGKMISMKPVNPRLHAYIESPLLKNEIVSVKNPIHSRKILTYSQKQQVPVVNPAGYSSSTTTTKKDSSMGQQAVHTKLYQLNSQTSTFLNKKFTSTKQSSIQPPAILSAKTALSENNSGLIKSPSSCSTTKSPTNMQGHSSSPRNILNDTLVKDTNSGMQNVYFTKKQFTSNNNTKHALNMNR